MFGGWCLIILYDHYLMSALYIYSYLNCAIIILIFARALVDQSIDLFHFHIIRFISSLLAQCQCSILVSGMSRFVRLTALLRCSGGALPCLRGCGWGSSKAGRSLSRMFFASQPNTRSCPRLKSASRIRWVLVVFDLWCCR